MASCPFLTAETVRAEIRISFFLSLARCLTVSLLPSLSSLPISYSSFSIFRLHPPASHPPLLVAPFLHPPRTPPMDNDYSGLSNPCIPNVAPPGADPSLVDFREFYPYIPNEIKHRKRTTQAQLEILEQTFAHDKKPNGVMRANLAKQLDMTPRGVQVSARIFIFLTLPDANVVDTQVWFQNRCAPPLHIPSSPSINPNPALIFHAGGRKKRRWPKRPPPNFSHLNSSQVTPQTPKRVLARIARLHCSGAPRSLPTANLPRLLLPSLLLQLMASTCPKSLNPQFHLSPPLDTT